MTILGVIFGQENMIEITEQYVTLLPFIAVYICVISHYKYTNTAAFTCSLALRLISFASRKYVSVCRRVLQTQRTSRYELGLADPN